MVYMIVVILDQTTKAIVMARIPEGGPQFEDRDRTFFYITHQRNYGLVGGLFRDKPMVAFMAPLFATAVLLVLYPQLSRTDRFQSMAYGAIGAGDVPLRPGHCSLSGGMRRRTRATRTPS